MYELVELQAGQLYPPHIHHHSTAELYFIQGEGTLALDTVAQTYAPGKNVTVQKGVAHGFYASTQTLFLSIQTPPIIDPQTGKIDLEYVGKH
jgi:quercetin dioxygenase-like cupin family protein